MENSVAQWAVKLKSTRTARENLHLKCRMLKAGGVVSLSRSVCTKFDENRYVVLLVVRKGEHRSTHLTLQ
jgi:hypothetical protein